MIMHRKAFFKPILSLLLLFGLLSPACLGTLDNPHSNNETKQVKKDTTTKRTLNVAISEYPGFLYTDNGTVTGYAAEYLSEIGKINNWEYNYVSKSFSAALSGLTDGTIDIVTGVQKAPGREDLYDFSANSMGKNVALLCTLKDNNKYAYGDYASFEGMKIGGIKGSEFVTMCQEFMVGHGVTAQFINYDTDALARQAIKDGDVDSLIMGTIRYTDDYTVIDKVGWVDMYFASRKSDTSIKDNLDYAQDEILLNNLYYESELDKKYFSNINSSLNFTEKERTYIKDNPTITLGYVPNQDPVSYTDSETHEFGGITRSITDLIEEYSGIKFNYVQLKEGKVDYQFLLDNNIGLISSVEYNDINLASKGMKLSNPYLYAQKVFVMRSDEKFDKNANLNVAMATGSGTVENFLKTEYPNFSITPYNTVEESLLAVANGEADIAMQNQYVVTRLLSKPKFENLYAVPVEGLADKLCLSSMLLKNSDGSYNTTYIDGTLTSILNKSIENISDEDLSEIVALYTSGRPYHLTFEDTIYKYRVPIIFIVILVVCLIGSIVYILINRQQHIKKMTLKNEELAIAAKKADAANVAKSQFLAQMSHEIRTPMNAIIGLTTIAKTELDDPDRISDDLMKIEKSSKLLLGIINDVLDMSAIDGGKMKLASAPFNFKQLIANITALFYKQAKQKNINFETKILGLSEETIVGDELRVNQILMNLLSNAIKFTPVGGSISLVISQMNSSKEKVQLRFEVSDTGCGMNEDMLKRLFKPFEQESATTAKKYGGSGLGLSITKNIVKMMNGTINVTSKVGEGTTFTVDIPFIAHDDKDSVKTELFSKIRTLIIDSDQESCEYTALLMKRLKIRYDMVNDGEKALEFIGEAEDKKDPYKLCLIDWKTPKVDNEAVSTKIREIFGDDQVIVISSYDVDEVEAQNKQLKANYFVSKPLFQSTLFNVLMRISGGKYNEKQLEKAKNKYDFTGRRVLVAEDVALNLEVAVKLLNLVNVEVVCAEDGKQALEVYKKFKPNYFDCILLDINMPIMDGYEAARAIRASKREDSTTIKIYAMTANAFSSDVTKAIDAGMDGHIAKPIETDVLYSTLEKAFEEKDKIM